MRSGIRGFSLFVIYYLFFVCVASAQVGNAGSIEGIVKDPSGAAVVGATVEIAYGVSGYIRTATTGPDGTFRRALSNELLLRAVTGTSFFTIVCCRGIREGVHHELIRSFSPKFD